MSVADTAGVVSEVMLERARQEELVREGRLRWTAAHPDCPDEKRLQALVEEVGEVARALHDEEGADRLREELIQVAAVAVAWVEAL